MEDLAVGRTAHAQQGTDERDNPVVTFSWGALPFKESQFNKNTQRSVCLGGSSWWAINCYTLVTQWQNPLVHHLLSLSLSLSLSLTHTHTHTHHVLALLCLVGVCQDTGAMSFHVWRWQHLGPHNKNTAIIRGLIHRPAHRYLSNTRVLSMIRWPEFKQHLICVLLIVKEDLMILYVKIYKS